jgi:hypothetical protein
MERAYHALLPDSSWSFIKRRGMSSSLDLIRNGFVTRRRGVKARADVQCNLGSSRSLRKWDLLLISQPHSSNRLCGTWHRSRTLQCSFGKLPALEKLLPLSTMSQKPQQSARIVMISWFDRQMRYRWKLLVNSVACRTYHQRKKVKVVPRHPVARVHGTCSGCDPNLDSLAWLHLIVTGDGLRLIMACIWQP